MTHEVKILEEFAEAHAQGLKPWEIRYNDRDYQVGDIIKFNVIDKNRNPVGTTYKLKISYMIKGKRFGIEKGFCIMTLTKCPN